MFGRKAGDRGATKTRTQNARELWGPVWAGATAPPGSGETWRFSQARTQDLVRNHQGTDHKPHGCIYLNGLSLVRSSCPTNLFFDLCLLLYRPHHHQFQTEPHLSRLALGQRPRPLFITEGEKEDKRLREAQTVAVLTMAWVLKLWKWMLSSVCFPQQQPKADGSPHGQINANHTKPQAD